MDCQPATVRKHREMNPGASDAIEVLEPDDGGLGIRSRSQLDRALPGDPDTVAPH